MLYTLLVSIVLSVLISGCKSSTPVPVPATATLSWTAGQCKDSFIVYQQVGTQWVSVSETSLTKMSLGTLYDGKTLTVAGVCNTGPSTGVWQSTERVQVKR